MASLARFLFWLIGLPVALAILVFAAANREDAVIDLWPLPFEVGLPVFLLVLVPLVLGFLLGGLAFWMQSVAARATARAERRRAAALERELAILRGTPVAPVSGMPALTDRNAGSSGPPQTLGSQASG